MNLAKCYRGACSCLTGFFDNQCAENFSQVDRTAYLAITYLNVALWGLAFASSLVILILLVRAASFRKVPRFKRSVAGVSFIALSTLLHLLSWAIDRYKFNASAGGYLTEAYDIGLTILSSFALCFLVWGYNILMAEWLSVRQVSKASVWNGRVTALFIIMCGLCLAMAIVSTLLRLVLPASTCDTIFFAFLAATSVGLSATISISAALSLRDLATFFELAPARAKLMRKLALNAVAVGVSLFCATIILIVLSSVPYNSSVYSFLMIRLFVPNLVALALAVLVLVHFARNIADRFKTTITLSKAPDDETENPSSTKSPGQVSSNISSRDVVTGFVEL